MTELLGVRATARRLGVHENTVRNWAHSGFIRSATSKPDGTYMRFDEAEVGRVQELLAVSARNVRAVYVWLAEQYNMGAKEQLGIFSDPVKARKSCQNVANEYFGEAHTPTLDWRGDDENSSATTSQPVTGMWVFLVTRYAVDEETWQ